MLKTSRRRRLLALRNRLTIIFFLLCISLPAVGGLFGIAGISHFTENRVLKPFPRSVSPPQAFLHGLDDYISDRFGFRPLLISAVNYAKLLMRVSGMPRVAIGHDDWLFYSCDCPGADPPVGVAGVRSYANAFVERARWVASRGAHFTFYVVPAKEALYQEHVPEWMRLKWPHGAAAVLRDALQDQPVDLFYPKGAMLAAEHAGKLYYRYDTHWTPIGALFGAQELIDHLHQLNPAVPAFSLDDYAIETPGPTCIDKYDGSRFDLLVMDGAPALTDTCPQVERKGGWTAKLTPIQANEVAYPNELVYTKNDPSLPTAVFYVDSFGTALQRFAAEYFRRSVFLNPWQQSDVVYTDVAKQFPAELVKEQNPDFVIYLRVETNLFIPTGNPPEVAKFATEPAR